MKDDYTDQAIKAMKEDLLDKKFKLNVEYRVGGQVTIFIQICLIRDLLNVLAHFVKA